MANSSQSSPRSVPDAPSEAEREDRRRADLQLVHAVLMGDAESVHAFGKRMDCVPRILSILNWRMGKPLSAHDQADLAQDTLIVIWKKLKTFAGRATLETWVHRISFLEFMNRVRSLDRLPVSGSDLDAVFEEEGPGDAALLDYERLAAGLEELGQPEADIVRMKHFEDLTFTQIGEALDISTNTAKTQYYRGIAWLKRHLVARERGVQE